MKLLGRAVSVSVFALFAAAAFPSQSARAAQPTCESLKDLKLPDTTINSAATVPAGTAQAPAPAMETTACRVTGSIKPTSDSDIRFEVWMPATGWNRKFLSAGEGGYAGSINYGGIKDALKRGYAGGSTDTGHVGGTADFAPGHPEKVTDFGWRGKHLQAARSKDIIRAFYRQSIAHSYFSSCSNGGRQALMEIQRFPEDYDGVLVGAPANDWSHLFAGFIWNEQALWNTPGAFLSPSNLAAIQKATLDSCDKLDGVEDGVVEDPRRCTFDPATIACTAQPNLAGCLTAPQVTSTQKIMSGARNPRTGKQIFPGWFTSAAAAAGSWGAWITGPAAPGASIQAFFGNSYFGRIIHEIPPPGVWDFSTFNFDSDMTNADRKAVGGALTMNSTDPELGDFRHANHRGKIIHWHGWEDPAISALTSINYYREVVAANDDASDFYRMFMVPGMVHCGGGPGPNSFGQSLPQAKPLDNAPENDILSALERWVEKGVAPTRIVAVKYVNDQPASGVLRTRPLCAYPRTAVYRGTGSTNKAENFDCRTASQKGDDRDQGDDED